MQRRNFIKTTGLAGLAATAFPYPAFAQEVEYSVLELMGKVDIELFGSDINLRQEPYEAFLKMKKAAYNDGFDIKIVSSYRNFYRQQAIWERKYLQYTDVDGMAPMEAITKIIEYSTIPGTSRHHWGTEIDIIDGYRKTTGDVLLAEKFEGEGPFSGLKQWMDENSEDFGFYLVYTDNYFRKGFKYEPWHYSYAPNSIPMLEQFRKKNIFKLIQNEEFEGVEHFTTSFLKTYIHDNILDINPALL
ncbi:M15 family metallopeptidase [Flagellimonas sp. DF-77]|uniref:M15 family metallopeptidase n=1 Tax=Flagellimonas algarum TaxID=3230298 RepID=UPI0033930ABD